MTKVDRPVRWTYALVFAPDHLTKDERRALSSETNVVEKIVANLREGQ